MKCWIYRTKPKYEWNDSYAEHFIEQNPDKAFIYTKLYLCYDKPLVYPCPESSRNIEIPNFWFPEVKCGTLVEMKNEEYE